MNQYLVGVLGLRGGDEERDSDGESEDERAHRRESERDE